MTILILHQHFCTPYEGGAIRSYYLAKALVDAGKNVIVITGGNTPRYSVKNVDGIEVHYLPIAYENRFGFVARSWSFIKYIFASARLAGKLRKVDYCYAISVPLTIGLAAMWIKARHKIPFYFEVGDLWPDAPIQMGFIKNYVFSKSLYALEKKIYHAASALVALSPAIQTAIEKKVPGKKVHLIPNMSDTEFYRPEEKNSDLENKLGVAGKFVISYIGAVGAANGLDYFLECANASRKAGLPIQFFICGEGALKARLKNDADRLGLSNLTFLDFRNREGVRELMNITDAAFVCYKPVPILETGSPNKFFDALAAGKMVIINFGGWIKKEIEEHHCGISVNPANPLDFIKKIRPVLEDRRTLKDYQKSARQLAEKKYSRAKLSDRFVEIFGK